MQSGSGRVLLCSWWLLTLVVAAAYSGTLTAYLSVSRHHPVFKRTNFETHSRTERWGGGRMGLSERNDAMVYSRGPTLKPTRGLRDWAEGVWGFPSATMPWCIQEDQL